MQHVVAGLSDRDIQLVVGADGDELPAVGFVFRQLVVDRGRLRRVVEHVVNLVDLVDLGEFGDVQRAVMERDAVGPVEAGGQHLDLAFAVLVGDRIDLVDEAAADEHRALVALGQRTRIGHAGGVDLDVEAGRHLELGQRQLVGRGGQWWARDGRKFRSSVTIGTPDQGRTRRKRRRGSGGSARSRGGRLLRCGTECKRTDKGASQQQAARRRKTDGHQCSPFVEALIPKAGFPRAGEQCAARMASRAALFDIFLPVCNRKHSFAKHGDESATRAE